MDVLVDLSEPEVSAKKPFTTTEKVRMSPKVNQISPKLIKKSCATGILIDFSDPEKIAMSGADEQSISSDCSKTPDESDSQLISLDGPGFDISQEKPAAISSFGRSKNAENPSLSPLNAHQMAEIFEQANTIAVRIELANARRRTCSADASGAETSSPVGNKVNDEFSPDGIIVTDEHLKAATSTPANQVVPDVNAHFWRADLEKSLCLEMDEKATVVSREQPTAKKQMQLVGRMKQLSTDTNQGKTLIGQAPSLRTSKAGMRASTTSLLAPKTKTDSLYNSRNSTTSSSVSDSKVPLKAPTSRVSVLRPRASIQPKSDADCKTSEVLTRSLDTPAVPTVRPSMRRTMESTEILNAKKKALVLNPSRKLPPRPPGRLEKEETGVKHGTNPARVPAAANKLQRMQSIPRKVGSQITAAEKSGSQSKKL